MRLSAVQVRRAHIAAGGVWTLAKVASIVGIERDAVYKWRDRPEPIEQLADNLILYAGEDILDWLEQIGKWYAAEVFYTAVQERKRDLRQGA